MNSCLVQRQICPTTTPPPQSTQQNLNKKACNMWVGARTGVGVKHCSCWPFTASKDETPLFMKSCTMKKTLFKDTWRSKGVNGRKAPSLTWDTALYWFDFSCKNTAVVYDACVSPSVNTNPREVIDHKEVCTFKENPPNTGTQYSTRTI